MVEQTVDFWTDIATAPRRVTALSLMKQQAVRLGKHTNNLLEGDVSSNINGERLVHRFRISVPTLDYSYELFRISHDVVVLYPVNVESSKTYYHGKSQLTLDSEEAFMDWLKNVLSSDETKRVLGSLLAQVES
jgi:hypothetical protein